MARRNPPGRFHELGSFRIPTLIGARRVRVYEPSRRDPGAPRPVLFLFDGQNVFGHEGSYAGGWHAHEAVDGLVAKTQVAPLVVGIDHGAEHRVRELNPWSQASESSLDAFLDWIGAELAPKLVDRFGATPGAIGSVLAGSSMGGLASLYGHFRFPQYFGGALAMSPSLWVGRGRLLQWIRSQAKPQLSRVYVDAGGLEGGGRMLEAAKSLALGLAARGYDARQLMWRPELRGRHNEASWRRRLPKALRFMFRR